MKKIIFYMYCDYDNVSIKRKWSPNVFIWRSNSLQFWCLSQNNIKLWYSVNWICNEQNNKYCTFFKIVNKLCQNLWEIMFSWNQIFQNHFELILFSIMKSMNTLSVYMHACTHTHLLSCSSVFFDTKKNHFYR